MSHNFKRGMSKTALVAGFVSVLFLASACGSVTTENATTESDPAATSASGNATPSPASETSSASDSEYGPTIDGMTTLPVLASDKEGEWRKITLRPDDPAYTINPNVINPETAAMWSEEEIATAHKIAVDYAVDMIDTFANGQPGDEARAAEWWEVNKSKFHPVYHELLRADVSSTDRSKPIVFKGSDMRDEAGNKLMYGSDKVHVRDLKITTTEIVSGQLPDTAVKPKANAMLVTVQLNYSNVVVSGEGVPMDEKLSASISPTFVKDETTGAVVMSGYDNWWYEG